MHFAITLNIKHAESDAKLLFEYFVLLKSGKLSTDLDPDSMIKLSGWVENFIVSQPSKIIAETFRKSSTRTVKKQRINSFPNMSIKYTIKLFTNRFATGCMIQPIFYSFRVKIPTGLSF